MEIIDRDLIGDTREAYLIGIGGVGMSALARVLKHHGLTVRGSDCQESRTTRELVQSGIPVLIGQEQIGFREADLVIYSSAVRPDHLELNTARQKGKKVYHRAEILSSLLNRAKTSVAITGTHGKTTTSSMISFALSALGKNPTCLVGGEVINFGTNALLGGADLWVSEVDESDQTHELYAPNYTVLTNLEEDHMDHYKDLEALKLSFGRFVENARDPGLVVYCVDDRNLAEVLRSSRRPTLGYGFSSAADFSAHDVHPMRFGYEYDLWETGFFVTHVKLSVPGLHNVSNSLAAIALLTQLGLEPEAVASTLERFRGARRRLEMKWESQELVVVDDYAHHPTEIRASLRALRNMEKRLTVIFQPHRYSRTQHLLMQFAGAFQDADELILTDIYGAGESNTSHIGVRALYDQVVQGGHPSVRMLEKHEILSYLLNCSDLHGIVAFVGAGDIGEIADEFANRFKNLTTA